MWRSYYRQNGFNFINHNSIMQPNAYYPVYPSNAARPSPYFVLNPITPSYSNYRGYPSYDTQPSPYLVPSYPNYPVYPLYQGELNQYAPDLDFPTGSNNILPLDPYNGWYPTGDEVEVIPKELWEQQEAKQKEAAFKLAKMYLNHFKIEGYAFSNAIKIGDEKTYKEASDFVKQIKVVDLTTKDYDAKYSSWSKTIILSQDPIKANKLFDYDKKKDLAEDIWHELSHTVEHMNGEMEWDWNPFTSPPVEEEERNVDYMTAVITEALIWLQQAEKEAKQGASVKTLKGRWDHFVKKMNDIKSRDQFIKYPPNLDWFGFDVDVEKIRIYYASGKAKEIGYDDVVVEKLKKMVTPIDGDDQPSDSPHIEYQKCIQSCYNKYKDNEQKYIQCIQSCMQQPPEPVPKPIPSEPSKVLKTSAVKGGNKVSDFSEVKWAFAIPVNLYDTGQIAMKTNEAKLRFVAKWYWKMLTVNVQLSSAYHSEKLTEEKRRLTIPYTYTWNGVDHRGKTHEGEDQSKTSIDYYIKDLKEDAEINIDTSSFTLQGPKKD